MPVWMFRLLSAFFFTLEVRELVKIGDRLTAISVVIGTSILSILALSIYLSFMRKKSSYCVVLLFVLFLPLCFWIALNVMEFYMELQDWLVVLPIQMLLPICFAWYFGKSVKVREYYGFRTDTPTKAPESRT